MNKDDITVFKTGATEYREGDRWPYTVIGFISDDMGIVSYIVVQADFVYLLAGRFRDNTNVMYYARNIEGEVIVLHNDKERNFWVDYTENRMFSCGHRTYSESIDG